MFPTETLRGHRLPATASRSLGSNPALVPRMSTQSLPPKHRDSLLVLIQELLGSFSSCVLPNVLHLPYISKAFFETRTGIDYFFDFLLCCPFSDAADSIGPHPQAAEKPRRARRHCTGRRDCEHWLRLPEHDPTTPALGSSSCLEPSSFLLSPKASFPVCAGQVGPARRT